jgi:hypothetical protein
VVDALSTVIERISADADDALGSPRGAA